MDWKKELQKAVNDKETELGIEQTLRNLRKSKGRFVVLSNNCPERETIENYAKLAGIEVFDFLGDSIDLGATVKKPFSVSAVLVKKYDTKNK